MERGSNMTHSRIVIMLISGLFSWFLIGTGCKNTRQITAGNVPTEAHGQQSGDTGSAHNSRNSLDWAGVYTGKMPCDDCNAVNAQLALNDDGTFNLRYKFDGKSDSIYTKKGTFQWDKTGSTITMKLVWDYPLTYRVIENGLEELDQNGNPIEGEFAYLTRFTKMDENMVQEKYWKLTQLNGQSIEFKGNKEPYMILKAADSTVKGFAGCNGFGGHVDLLPGNRIRFSKLISTMMACQDLALEKSFLKVLEKADNYTQHGDTLYLNKARMAPLAQFVAVYL